MKVTFSVNEEGAGWTEIALQGNAKLVAKLKNLIDALELETI